ncbi:peptide ABC transporter substrate-binding protein [Tissierella praeacuta]|uniref:peptide ABC transporter substrate-binding protein n=1 Tax=Tissierella praeacuta TaxID=43131 RepID=UPI003510F8A0
MSKKYLAIVICMILVFTTVTGCGNKMDVTIDNSVEGGTNGESNSKEPERFTWRISTDPPTLDPQINNKSVGNTVIDNIFEGLIRENEKLEIEPALAEKWDISEDGLIYTFHLRKNAKWSDGQPITTKDFLYSWKRALSPEMAVAKAGDYFIIKNAEKYYKGDIELSEVGFEMPDDYTIKIELAFPIPEDEVLYNLTSSVFFPLREDIIAANPDNWTTSPEKIVTNGPFKMKSYKMNEELVLEKDENYWDKANKAMVNELRFVFIDDGLTTLRAFEAGEIDGFTGVPSEEIPRLTMESEEFYLLPKISFSFFALNVNKEPLNNKKVREALVLAIDKVKLAEASVSGLSKAATGLVPFGATSIGKDFRIEADKDGPLSPPNGNIQKAKAALAEVGYPDGKGFPKIEYLYNASPSNKQMAEMLQEMWKKNLNIEVELTNVEYKVESERRHSGEFQLARSTWNGSRFPFSFLSIFATGDYNNNPHYSNPDYDALVNKIRTEIDLVKRDELLHQAEQFILNEYIVCPISYGTSSMLLSSRAKDIRVTPTGGVIFYHVYIEN